jgi:3-hexulose-6-phosphate synthase
VVKIGAHIIGVHTGLDQQAAGQTPFADLALVTGLKTGAKVSVAGGVKAATVKQVVDAGADIVVAGAAIYGAADPAASATEITKLAHGSTAATGGFKWLPWAIAIAAALLVLSLLTNKKPAEEAVDAAVPAAVEAVEGAADAAAAATTEAVETTTEAVEAATTSEAAPAAEAAPAEAAQ